MPNANRYPSYSTCVSEILSGSSEPVTLDGIVAQVGERRPISKNGHSAIKRALSDLYQVVPVGPSRYAWLSHLIQGTTIRHTLVSDEVRRGYILLDELEHALFYPEFFQRHRATDRVLSIELFGDQTVKAAAVVEDGTWALHIGAPLAEWLDECGAQANDDLIIHVVDAVEGLYRVRLQPSEARDEEAIEERNQLLARAAEELAEEISNRRFFTWELVARLLAGTIFRDALPPDDMHFVLESLSRLQPSADDSYLIELRAQRPARSSTPPRIAPSSTPIRGRSRSAASKIEGDLMDRSMRNEFDDVDDEDSCAAYDEYKEAFKQSRRSGEPLSHDDFHLLEAELETLVDLELEFGYLLPDQTARKQELADRLFIDPETLVDSWEDDGDTDDSALWN